MNENKEMQPEAEKPLCGELKVERHELEEAIADERRAEHRVEAVAHRIPENCSGRKDLRKP